MRLLLGYSSFCKYSNNLESIAEYNNDEPLHITMEFILAVVECMRTSMGFYKIYIDGKSDKVSTISF